MAKNREIRIDMTIDGKQATGVITGLDSAVQGVARHTHAVSTSLSKWGNILTGINSAFALGGRAVSAISTGLNKYIEFEAGLKNVNTILNLSNEELKQYGNRLLDLSKKVGISGKDLTDAFYQAASAGVSAGDSIQFLEVAAKAANAGLSSTETAVDGLTTVINAFHLQTSEAGEVADVMFQTVKLGKTTFEELAGSLSDVAPIAAASNVEFKEVSAAIASLTKQGVPTSQAITQIKASIIAMNEQLGDGWANTMTLQEGMQAMADKAGGSQVKLKELTGRVEAMGAILGLTGANARTAAEDLTAMTTAVGEMNRAFEIQTESLDFKIKRLNTSFDALVISMTDNFAPALSWVMENFAGGLDIIFGKDPDIAAKENRIVSLMENFKGLSEEQLAVQLKLITSEWEIADAKLANSDLSISGRAHASKKAKEEIENAKVLLASYEEQAEAIKRLNAEKAKAPGVITAPVGGGSTPARPGLPGEGIESTEGLEEMIAFELDQTQEITEAYDNLALLKEEYFQQDLMRTQQGVEEKRIAAMQISELDQYIINAESEKAAILEKMNRVMSKDDLGLLKQQKANTEDRIELAKSLKEAQREASEQAILAGVAEDDASKSLASQLANSIRSSIKALIAKAVATQLGKVISTIPFPFNIFAAPAAGLAVSAMFDSLIPKFAYGGSVAGPRHSGGGVLLEAEGGEYIVNRNAARSNIALLEAINSNRSVSVSMPGDGFTMLAGEIRQQTERLERVERRISLSQFDEAYTKYKVVQTEIGN
uniref:Putative tail protein n=1 Tax=viral metagenome TaxID=1070528 RepID=A0A6M3XT21_9ZZZZ